MNYERYFHLDMMYDFVNRSDVFDHLFFSNVI